MHLEPRQSIGKAVSLQHVGTHVDSLPGLQAIQLPGMEVPDQAGSQEPEQDPH